MLRYGRVLNPTEEDARIVNLLNDRIHNDPRVENVLLPFRDGIMLAYKLITQQPSEAYIPRNDYMSFRTPAEMKMEPYATGSHPYPTFPRRGERL